VNSLLKRRHPSKLLAIWKRLKAGYVPLWRWAEIGVYSQLNCEALSWLTWFTASVRSTSQTSLSRGPVDRSATRSRSRARMGG
jgi:hypothetical protein